MKDFINITFSHSAGEVAAFELRRGMSLALGGLSPLEGVTITLEVKPFLPDGVDGYRIDVDWQGGDDRIVGSNPRSVLFGACRLLHEQGFRWTRPGPLGEVIPTLEKPLPVHLESQAGHLFRGLCIEGGDSRENILETLEWMCRNGMNAYYIQFRDALVFFSRWYNHEENPLLRKEPFDAAAITRDIRHEVARRGMELQMVGHGWTCDPFGIPGASDWYARDTVVPPEIVPYLAEVNGKRELWGKIALNTNLCYSKPEVRRTITTAIADFAHDNPDIDVIHFWLADGVNNSCECAECRVKSPSDWYAQMLCELDDEMTRRSLPTRIVFLIYSDLLWPPQAMPLRHPERFILMFAPITRSYSTPLPLEEDADAPLPEYRHNHNHLPRDPKVNMQFLRGWQKHFHGKGFDFDYHFQWDHFKDPGYYQIAQILQEDCRNLHRMGLDGMISCQVQRAFFPHGLGMVAMAQTLWNPEVQFDDIARDFFRDAYGTDGGDDAHRYFRAVSELFNPTLIRGEGTPEECRALATHLVADYEEVVKAIAPSLAKARATLNGSRLESWLQLELHIERTRLMAKMLEALWLKGRAAAEEPAEALRHWARANEARLQREFDLYEFLTTIDLILKGCAIP